MDLVINIIAVITETFRDIVLILAGLAFGCGLIMLTWQTVEYVSEKTELVKEQRRRLEDES